MIHDDLGHFLKVGVRREEAQPVLHRAGGDPEIVGGDGRPGFPESI